MGIGQSTRHDAAHSGVKGALLDATQADGEVQWVGVGEIAVHHHQVLRCRITDDQLIPGVGQ